MKGKLIKEADFYGLKIDDKIVGLSDDITNNLLNYPYKLSKKNCEAIANGYDLDELAYEKSWNEDSEKGFINGAKAILEILGDKKFSEDDMKKAFEKGALKLGHNRYFDELIQSLQQTEWNVEIIMDRIPADLAPGGWDVFPKLDAENCLILKRIE